mgnify:CR=1 FL=1
MKKKEFLLLMLTVFVMNACGDLTNNLPVIEIDPVFKTSGFVDVDVISLNEKETHLVSYSRIYGISRALTMNLTVDESALTSYNAENNKNYVLLPNEYYKIPDNVTFEIKEKNADFEIEISSKKLYQASGTLEAAGKYVLPIRAIATEQSGVKMDDASNTILLHVNMLPATVDVYVPSEMTKLEFVANSGSEEYATITCTQNFEGADPLKVSVEAEKSANLLIGGVQYTLLPDDNYRFHEGVINVHGEIELGVSINANNLSDEFKYILPCRVKTSSNDYHIDQYDLIYYVVEVTDLRVSVVDASEAKSKKAYSGTNVFKGLIDVNINSIINDDISVEFVYDASLVDHFNTANRKDFKVLPNENITITGGKINAGAKGVKIPFEVQLSSLTLNDGVHYLVPFVLQEDKLELGSISGSGVIYFDVAKTLEGEYTVAIIENGRVRSGVGNKIWPASECARAGDAAWDAVIENAQYGFVSDTSWDGYCTLFSVTDEDVSGMPNCKKVILHTFLELIVENGGSNEVRDNNSYFNTETGEIYIDCRVYESWFEQAYREVYSFKKS